MQFLISDAMGTPVWQWAGFLALVFGLMALDLGVFYRRAHVIGVRESLRLSAFYIALALAFALFINLRSGPQAAFLYLTGYVVEQSLSMDNILVMAVILGYFAIPRQYQHRVLFYGILGVIALRGVMILAGAALIGQFHWILYLFAAFLVATGIKMLVSADTQYNVAANPVLRFMSRHFRITQTLRGDRFLVREPEAQTGRIRWFVTPLLVALCVVEIADLIFAVDSIPAIFAITTDPFIVFTSNIFAILGLRSLYFVLSALLYRFSYLKYALSLVLVFIGAKILLVPVFGIAKVPPGWSLAITLAILGAGVAASLWKTAESRRRLERDVTSRIADASGDSVAVASTRHDARPSETGPFA